MLVVIGTMIYCVLIANITMILTVGNKFDVEMQESMATFDKLMSNYDFPKKLRWVSAPLSFENSVGILIGVSHVIVIDTF